MAVEIGVFRLIREALYFFSLIFSSHRTRELYDLLWELQIDVSIIYSFLIVLYLKTSFLVQENVRKGCLSFRRIKRSQIDSCINEGLICWSKYREWALMKST